jgi:hypothetical protein
MEKEKLNIAQGHIDQYSKRIEYFWKSMAIEIRDAQNQFEKKDEFWLENTAKKMAELCQEIRQFKKSKNDMQDLLDFINREEE